MAHALRGKTAIVGIGTAGTGEAPGRSAIELLGEASLNAIADAGLTLSDVDGIFAATSTHAFPTLSVGEYLGIRPRFFDGTNVGGASFEALKGAYDRVIAAAHGAGLLIYGGTIPPFAGHSYYTVETHIRHLGEAKLGQALYTTLQLLSSDGKRLHFFTRIHDAASGNVIATAEQMMVHVDSKAGKSVEAPADVLAKIKPIAEAHAKLAAPEGAGRSVGQRKAQ